MKIHNVIQGSPEWFLLRIGMVTGGTRLKRVFKSEYLSLIDEVIAEQLTETWDDEDYVSLDMLRGKELEPDALDRYEKETGLTLIRNGFIQSDKFPMLGYSPDGRVDITGGVEVKCPTTKKHVQYIRQNQLPNDYKWQVFGAFIINPDLQWYDFMSYDPRLQQRPVFIHRTVRKDIVDELKTAEAELTKFFAKLEKIKGEVLFGKLEAA